MFRVTPAGAVQTVVSFTGTAGVAPGHGPTAGLVLGPDGSSYGTNTGGGSGGFGTVFSLSTAASPVFTSIRSFADLVGSQPVGELVAADATTLLGTVAAGGSSGWGGVYKLSTAGVFTLLAPFTGEGGIVPGASPCHEGTGIHARLVRHHGNSR